MTIWESIIATPMLSTAIYTIGLFAIGNLLGDVYNYIYDSIWKH